MNNTDAAINLRYLAAVAPEAHGSATLDAAARKFLSDAANEIEDLRAQLTRVRNSIQLSN